MEIASKLPLPHPQLQSSCHLERSEAESKDLRLPFAHRPSQCILPEQPAIRPVLR
jgi:hypothetical protein